MRIGRNAFVQGICANIGEGERYFSKSSRAHGAPARIHYLCVSDRLIQQRDSLSQLRISCSQSRDSCIQLRISCSRQKVVRFFQKWYDFSESRTTFSRISCSHRRISCSRRKVVPLFRITATPIAGRAILVPGNALCAHALIYCKRSIIESRSPMAYSWYSYITIE